MSFIQCNNLTRIYHRGDVELRPLDNLNLTVESGEFLILMGPSGSGKTTLLNLMAGIDQATSGELIIDGQNIEKLSRNQLAEWRSHYIGYIFQLYNLIPILTAYENAEVPLLLHDISAEERHERVVAALGLAGISDRYDHYPRQLSGGQEQRVAIARAIVSEPKIIVADEPTGDLDKASAERIMTLLQRLNRELGMTLIMVTHDPSAAKYGTRCLHLDKGQLAEEVSHVST
jgi:putative ABC transport system ATP-binding protein